MLLEINFVPVVFLLTIKNVCPAAEGFFSFQNKGEHFTLVSDLLVCTRLTLYGFGCV